MPQLRVLEVLAGQRVEPAGQAQELDRGSMRLIEPPSIYRLGEGPCVLRLVRHALVARRCICGVQRATSLSSCARRSDDTEAV
jgi:hypothetical protein